MMEMQTSAAQAALPYQFADMRQHLVHTVQAIPEEKYNYKPTNGGWSAAETMQHLLLSAQLVADMQAKARTEPTQRDPAGRYGVLEQVFLDYDQKYNAAENIVPYGAPFDKHAQLGAINTAFDALQQQLSKPGITEELVEYPVPGFGVMTRLEFIYLVTLHSTRHIRQIKAAAAQA